MGNMGKLLTKIGVIITELKRLQTVPHLYRDENDEFPLPRFIYAGKGGSITISKLIDDTIINVADQLMDICPNTKTSFTLTDWRASVRHAFGPALAAINLNNDLTENAEKVGQMVASSLNKQMSGYGIREYAFGCTLFSNKNICPFDIGPVRFELRNDWLIRKKQNGEVSNVTFRRVVKKWQGKCIGKRQPSRDYLHEKDILDSIGGCSFVCSVKTNNLSPDAAREKSLTAARLSTDAIALLWESPSRQLDGINLLFDRSLNKQIALQFIPGKRVLAGWKMSHLPHGPYDSGSAIGTAIDAQFHFTGNPKIDWNVYSGLAFDMAGSFDIERYDLYEADDEVIADMLANDLILGWVSGKYEIGPRALGNRSILAAPFQESTRIRLNEIKQREQFRPIAPLCLEEDAARWFGCNHPSPHMLYTYSARTDVLAAVTHVNKTARIQTVSSATNRNLNNLLISFKARTGYGVLCNTSLNFNGRGFINKIGDLSSYVIQHNLDGFVVDGRSYILKSSRRYQAYLSMLKHMAGGNVRGK